VEVVVASVEALALPSGYQCPAKTCPHPVPLLLPPGRPGDGLTCLTRPKRTTRIDAWPQAN